MAQRLRDRVYRMFRRPMQFGSSVAVGACIVGFVPHSAVERRDEVAAIAPEPVFHAVFDAPMTPAEVSPGMTLETALPAAKSQQSPAENRAKDEDDGLLIHAKAALNRRDAKQALEYLAEHERRYPKSKRAAHRDRLRAIALKMASGKR